MTVGTAFLFTVHSSLFTPFLLSQVPQDTLPDSLKVDQDTIYTTEQFLKEQQQVNVRMPKLRLLGTEGPRPPLTRIVFDRDSIEWSNAATVSDLLAEVPGVYLWRGGYIGRPEPVNFQGRGAASAEYFLDGIPYFATGIDTVAVDPALFSLSFLDRVEVERWPAMLRIHLFTRHHDRLAPRSRIAIARGDNDYARYEGELERYYRNGLGFGLGADYLNSPTASGLSSAYSNIQAWVRGSYAWSERVGLQYQLVRSDPNRRPFVADAEIAPDTIGPGLDGTRTDAHFRLSLGGDSRRQLGPRADLIYARTGWDGEGLNQHINQVGGYLTYQASAFSISASGFHRTRWTPLELRGSLAWNPVAPFSVRADLAHVRHFGGRNSDYAVLAAGLEPVRGLALTGSARIGQVVAAPAIASDTAQEIRDFHASLAWNRGRFGFQCCPMLVPRRSLHRRMPSSLMCLRSRQVPGPIGLLHPSVSPRSNGLPWRAGTATPAKVRSTASRRRIRSAPPPFARSFFASSPAGSSI